MGRVARQTLLLWRCGVVMCGLLRVAIGAGRDAAVAGSGIVGAQVFVAGVALDAEVVMPTARQHALCGAVMALGAWTVHLLHARGGAGVLLASGITATGKQEHERDATNPVTHDSIPRMAMATETAVGIG